MAVRGFKTKIAFHMAILLLVSAIITDILVVIVVQNLWVQSNIDHNRVQIEALGELFWVAISDVDDAAVIGDKQAILSTLLAKSVYPALYITDQSRHFFFQAPDSNVTRKRLNDILNQAIHADAPQFEKIGYGRSVFWWQAQSVIVAVPVALEGDRIAGIAAVVPLTPIFVKLRQYNKFVLLYILINTAILTLVGIYRLFRIYLRPIDRIVEQANQYHDATDFLFAFRREDNELNRLSTALNQMLAQIGADKQALKQTVASLEEANRELQKVQREIVRAEKMAAVGRLAAGIAHEIGNPIGIVLGYLDLLNQNDLTPQEREDFLERTEMEIQRINTIIRQLLDLARPQEVKPQALSVHTVLNELIDVMRLQPIMDGIDLDVVLKAERDIVWADSGQLRQVFLNLLINAADAIKTDPDNAPGQISLRTDSTTDPAVEGQAFLVVVVEDNGPGIPVEDIGNLFDPFFTTKAPGKGTGLGLAVSYNIIEQLGGAMGAGNRKDRGAVFDIRLPIFSDGDTDESDTHE